MIILVQLAVKRFIRSSITVSLSDMHFNKCSNEWCISVKNIFPVHGLYSHHNWLIKVCYFSSERMPGKRFSLYMVFVALPFSFKLKQKGSTYNALLMGILNVMICQTYDCIIGKTGNKTWVYLQQNFILFYF